MVTGGAAIPRDGRQPLGKNCYNAAMGEIRMLTSGAGWSVSDIVCAAGPGDRPFEERYADACIAIVSEGTFQCRSTRGAALLAPSAILLGNTGECFECGHEHGVGDRCLAFHYAPDDLETVLRVAPGARRMAFSLPRLPALPRLTGLLAEAEAACDEGDSALLEEVALRLAAAVATLLADSPGRTRQPTRQDERRITAALRRIEAEADHDHRPRCRLQRPVDLQPPFSPRHGCKPQRLPRRALNRAAEPCQLGPFVRTTKSIYQSIHRSCVE